MTSPQFARQVIGWIEIDPAAHAPVNQAVLENDAHLAAVFARWAAQNAEFVSQPSSAAAPGEPANSPAPSRRSEHNASQPRRRRAARFPRRARADLAAISADLEAQLTDLRRRFAAAS